MEILIIALLVIVIVLLVVLIISSLARKNQDPTHLFKRYKEEIISAFSSNVAIISHALQNSADSSSKEVKAYLTSIADKLKDDRILTERRLFDIERKLAESLEQIRQTLERNIRLMLNSNETKLDEIQKTVDEKLTKTLNSKLLNAD